MRKIKHFVPFLLTLCIVFSLCFTAACSTSKELKSIALDTTNAKVDFSLGEEFRPTGLKVTATYKTGKSEVINTDNCVFDTDLYDAYTQGTYEIKVTYTSEGVSDTASYNVNVVDALFGGLNVSLKAGRTDYYTLTASAPTVNLSAASSMIEVRKPTDDGDVDMNSAVLDKSLYTVKVYKGDEEVSNLSAVNRGVYHIWAYMYDAKEDFTYKGFTTITVFDDVQGIVFKEGTTNQAKGLRETMTPTWKFTVTYNSGDTAVVDKTSPYLKISSINPNVAANAGTATVTYQEPNTNVRTIEVNYTLNGDQSNPDLGILSLISFETSTDNITSMTYKDNYGVTEFTMQGGKIVSKSASIVLPTGISIGGATTIGVDKAYQSGGASSASNGRYIYFTLDRNCEIYIYAQSNGEDDRCMYIETENDYATYGMIEGYKDINAVPTAPSSEKAPSIHAVSISGLDSDNPADFTLSFDASVNVYYILIIFAEEA